MKKLLKIIITCAILVLITNIITYVVYDNRMDRIENQLNDTTNIDSNQIKHNDSLLLEMRELNENLKKISNNVKPLDKFFDALGKNESGNNYTAVNTYGYIGKYQFGLSALVETGVCDSISQAKLFRDKFINAPDSLKLTVWSKLEQDQAMYNLLKINRNTLKEYIAKYDGKIVNGIYVTESGILAAAHLSGPKGVMNYFESKKNTADGYGTTVECYLKKFGGYKV